MSIIDRNAIFFEGPLKAQATGPVVALTALTLPGRMEPMPVRISVTEGFDPAEVESLALVLEESATADAEASGWTAVPGAAWDRASCPRVCARPFCASGSRRRPRKARRPARAGSSRP